MIERQENHFLFNFFSVLLFTPIIFVGLVMLNEVLVESVIKKYMPSFNVELRKIENEFLERGKTVPEEFHELRHWYAKANGIEASIVFVEALMLLLLAFLLRNRARGLAIACFLSSCGLLLIAIGSVTLLFGPRFLHNLFFLGIVGFGMLFYEYLYYTLAVLAVLLLIIYFTQRNR